MGINSNCINDNSSGNDSDSNRIVRMSITNDDCYDYWLKKNSVREWRLGGKKRTKTVETVSEITVTQYVGGRIVSRKVNHKDGRLKTWTKWHDNGKVFSEQTGDFVLYFSQNGDVKSIIDTRTQSRLVIYGKGVSDVVLETRLNEGLLHGGYYQFNYCSDITKLVGLIRSGTRLTYKFNCDTGVVNVMGIQLQPNRVENSQYQHGVKIGYTVHTQPVECET